MPFRLLIYIVSIWREYYKNTDENIRKRREFRLPPIFTIVLYNGANRWRAAKELKEMVEMGDVFKDYIPNFKYHLIDVRRLDEEELKKKGDAIAAVFLLEQGFGERDEKLREKLEGALSILTKEEENLARGVYKWLTMKMKNAGIDTSKIEEIDYHRRYEEAVDMIEIELRKRWKRAELKAKREYILKFLKARFGEVEETLKKEIFSIEESGHLDRLVELAALCNDLAEFKEKMG